MDEKEQNTNDNFEQLLDNDADQSLESSADEINKKKSTDDKSKEAESAEDESTDNSSKSTSSSPNKSPDKEPETTIEEVTEVIETDVVASPEAPKKKHTGLIVCILLFLFIAICGGVFAAFAIIKNQPENIAADAVSNFINAKKINVAGTFAFTPKTSDNSEIGPINVTLDSKTSDINQSGEMNVKIDLPKHNKTIELGMSEAVMKDGVIYLKANGLAKLYNDLLSELVQGKLEETIYQNMTSSLSTACISYRGEAYLNCLKNVSTTASDPTVALAIEGLIAKVDNALEKLIKKVDDQWVEISIKDILANDLIKNYINQTTKDSITKAYDCSIDFANNLSQNSNEFAELYSQNKFLKIEPAENSFYRLTLDAGNLASYINSLPKTQSVKDYLSCTGVSDSENISMNISESSISSAINYIPPIYARFDGFFTHNLAELKMDHDTNYSSIALDLNFTYPSGLTIEAPSNSIPIMTLVQDIYTDIMDVYQTLQSV